MHMAEDNKMLGITQKEIDGIWVLFEPMAPKRGHYPPKLRSTGALINRTAQRRNNRYMNQDALLRDAGDIRFGARSSLLASTVAMCDAHIQELERNLGQSPSCGLR